jgi:elongation factor G
MNKKCSDSVKDLDHIRNIGIIAHIDAGKTTLTERFLYYSGKTHRIGDIDAGNTVMDYLDEERARGITIVAAAASFPWKNNLYHLIDTPGHIDFTAEVERSLRVISGSVVVFSAVEGVEAQSEKVWRQSRKYNISKIAFINKMDRMGASFERIYKDIKTKFPEIKVAPFQIPVGEESTFSAIIDLVEMKMLKFEGDDREIVNTYDIPDNLLKSTMQYRDEMLSTVAELSDTIAELYLDEKKIPKELLKKETRILVIKNKLCPVFTGSARKNIGIQPLMDAISDYLPNPFDRPICNAMATESEKKIDIGNPSFCGLVFKIIASETADLLYLRTYSGNLKTDSVVFNPRTNEKIKIKRILRLYSKKVEPIDEVGPGDIVGLVGVKNTTTGDTLCSIGNPIALEGVNFPEPVISMAIEPKSSKDKDKLASSLNLLCREDPTLFLNIHESTGQYILSGMGELHLEINCKRLEKEFNLTIRNGAPRVVYRETLKNSSIETGILTQSIGETEYHAEVDIQYEYVTKKDIGIEVCEDIKDKRNIPKSWVKAAKEALNNGLKTGGNWGYPLIYIRAKIIDIRGTNDKTIDSIIAGAVLNSVQKTIRKGTKLFEPITKLEIMSPESTVGEITGYLQSKRALIHNIENIFNIKKLSCEVPLAEMFGFSKALPKLSGGRASFSMEPCGYQEISTENLTRIMGTTNSY